MQVIRHMKAAQFLARAKAWLETAEAENNLILGNSTSFETAPEPWTIEPYLLTVEHEKNLFSAALMTPPHHLVISRSQDLALRTLADWLLSEQVDISGVLGPQLEAKTFADYWVNKTGKQLRAGLPQRIYACSLIVEPSNTDGLLRRAANEDAELLLHWCRQFVIETGVPESVEEYSTAVPNKIRDGNLYVWEDGQVVSMAGLSGKTQHGIRVNLVYTPPHLRKKGYATSCVAALRQRMLDSGKSFCCLYTDLTNSTSNSIYQKIGYRPVCDVQDWIFE
jgi:predicted GNAT family acetyltransferase